MNWADWVILGILLISSLISLKQGFIKEALSVLNWGLAFFLAVTFRDPFALVLEPYISTPSIRDLASFLILFALALMVGALVNYLIGEFVKKSGLSGTDKMLGMLFGLVRGFIIVMVFLIFVPPLVAIDQDAWWKQSVLIPYLLEFEGWCRAAISAIVRFVGNLFA